MVYKIQVSQEAKEDLDSIIDYLLLFGEQPALNFSRAYKQQLKLLADGVIDFSLSRFPLLAKLGYHSVYFLNYVLLYYQENDKRVISHIFHQSQDYASLV